MKYCIGYDDSKAKMASLRIYREEKFKTKTAEELYELAERLLAASTALNRFNPLLLKMFGDDDSPAATS